MADVLGEMCVEFVKRALQRLCNKVALQSLGQRKNSKEPVLGRSCVDGFSCVGCFLLEASLLSYH